MNIRDELITLIDELKSVCKSYGLGNDGNEYKIITQVFLYKFLNDRFGCAVKKLLTSDLWEEEYTALPPQQRDELLNSLPADLPRLQPEQLVSALMRRREAPDFDAVFDETMLSIAADNRELFSTRTAAGTRIPLFERLCPFVTDSSRRADFARAVTVKLAGHSFEGAFGGGFDFFADIFEYLIKDYNTAGGGKYAEYYTPHAVAQLMARLLTGAAELPPSAECYDPSAGTGTLLLALWHELGGNCRVFAQDISQRSNKMLKLNMILNGLSGQLDNAVQGDTLLEPFHRSDDGGELRRFDFVVSNPPFKMDFSEIREQLAAQKERFYAGVPNVPAKKKDGMAVYACFLQHVINSLKPKGRAAVVVPTGFLTAKSGVENAALRYITENRLVYGVVSMPPNLFATTGTNVSVLFLDNSRAAAEVTLIDASKLGEEYRDNGFQRRRLRDFEAERIADAFLGRKPQEDFCAFVTFDEITAKNHALSAGQYFGVRLDDTGCDPQILAAEVESSAERLRELFGEGERLGREILERLDGLKFK